MEVETLMEWTIRKLEEMTRNAESDSFDRHVVTPMAVNTIGSNRHKQLSANGLGGVEPAREEKLYNTALKMRDLLAQCAPTRQQELPATKLNVAVSNPYLCSSDAKSCDQKKKSE
jgi:hypothetical protein